jgi:hypothetical protein
MQEILFPTKNDLNDDDDNDDDDDKRSFVTGNFCSCYFLTLYSQLYKFYY